MGDGQDSFMRKFCCLDSIAFGVALYYFTYQTDISGTSIISNLFKHSSAKTALRSCGRECQNVTARPCRQSFTTQLRIVGRDLVERVPIITNGEVLRNDTLIETRLSF